MSCQMGNCGSTTRIDVCSWEGDPPDGTIYVCLV